MSLSPPIAEAHYCPLQSQTNVYGLTKVAMPSGEQKILVASLRGKVISMEFIKTRPLSKEVPFTYIPGDAEILSIDAFSRQYGWVVGITFVKTSNNELNKYLNIYSEVEPGSEFNLDSIALGCQNLRLEFTPYQLYHTELMSCGSPEVVFLLGGSDGKIHLYREEKHLFNEESTEDIFPEFTQMPSPVTCMQCRLYDDYQRRVSTIGCQSGIFRVFHVNTITKEIISRWEMDFDSPISALHLFTLHTSIPCPSFVKQVIDPEDDNSVGGDVPDLHLVVASAIEPTVVYRSIIDRGLVEPLVLPRSAQYDAVLCVKICDIDFDGENEVMIGTYGQEVLVYKYYPDQRQKLGLKDSNAGSAVGKPGSTTSQTSPAAPAPSQSTSPEHDASPDTGKATLAEGEFKLLWQRSFADPVMGLDVADMTCDGLQEVIVTTQKGLHILQHDLEAVATLCLERLKDVIQPKADEDVFQ